MYMGVVDRATVEVRSYAKTRMTNGRSLVPSVLATDSVPKALSHAFQVTSTGSTRSSPANNPRRWSTMCCTRNATPSFSRVVIV